MSVSDATVQCVDQLKQLPLQKDSLRSSLCSQTQIEEHVFRSHGADHDWERICVLDETFTFPNGYFNVFDAVPEESVLVAQPRLGEAATGYASCPIPKALQLQCLPSMML